MLSKREDYMEYGVPYFKPSHVDIKLLSTVFLHIPVLLTGRTKAWPGRPGGARPNAL
jgi:hypothetical protein